MEPAAEHGNSLLTQELENVVVEMVRALSINNLPPSEIQIREMVRRR